jgi:hypothetical protein
VRRDDKQHQNKTKTKPKQNQNKTDNASFNPSSQLLH